MPRQRRAGILLHPTSLPGPYGIGSFDSHLHDFLIFIAERGFRLWQVLPLTPPAAGNSPYSSYSAFAGNHLLIDLDQLLQAGDLPGDVLRDLSFPLDRVDFERIISWKENMLRTAAATFFQQNDPARLEEFNLFCDTAYWLHDYALFCALKRHFNGLPWHNWPTEIAGRQPQALEAVASDLACELSAEKYCQWQFFRQWQKVREWARELGIAIVGDLPIFVGHDSVDVWCNREQFLLDDNGMPLVVAGVPPDYFSADGQLWGNPLYDWHVMKARGYDWWIARMRQMTDLFDLVRIDHFRGFVAAWHVNAGESTARNGNWVPGPGADFFAALKEGLGSLPLIAEDLGIITQDVVELKEQFALPGMLILQFAFDSDSANPYLPHNHNPDAVVYTGTHDNDTTQGWLDSIEARIHERLCTYQGREGDVTVDDLVRLALMSVADTAILPLQDLFLLPSDSRMNRPGVALGNWEWRYRSELLAGLSSDKIRTQLELYGRLNNP